MRAAGFNVDDDGNIIKKKKPDFAMEDLEEETGHTCMICREGYKYKPAEVLGFYVHSTRVDLAARDGLGGRQVTSAAAAGRLEVMC